MGIKSVAGGFYGWLRGSLKSNLGRLVLMVTGWSAAAFALNKYSPMTDSEFRTGLIFGGALLLGGYWGPEVKKVTWGKAAVEMHDRAERADRRDAATEMTVEDEQGTGAIVDPDEAVAAARIYAANLAMDSVLDPAGLGGGTVKLYVYLMDAEAGGLVPAFGQRTRRLLEQAPWRPGVGAVGEAYQSGQLVVAAGPETSDGTHGLDAIQQTQHPDLAAVAAMPILNASSTVIGVLAASERGSPPTAEPILLSPAVRGTLEARADACARVLIDLLGLFADDV